jgi:hypothetical protein
MPKKTSNFREMQVIHDYGNSLGHLSISLNLQTEDILGSQDCDRNICFLQIAGCSQGSPAMGFN